MAFAKLKEAREALDAKRDELKRVFDEAGPERDMDQVTVIPGDSNAKVDWIRARNDEITDLHAEVKRLEEIEVGATNAGAAREAGAENGEPSETPDSAKSLGQRLVESAAFKGFQGGTGPKSEIKIPSLRNTLFETSAGWSPESTRTDVVSLFPTRPAPDVVDFIPTLPTGQSAIKFMRETLFTNNAVEKAEGAAYGEAALTLTEVSLPVEKIPVFLAVTDEQLEDVEGVAAYIDQRLVFMIRQRLDAQVLVGDGATPNLEGTLNVSSINTQAKGADTVLDALYKGIDLVRTTGFTEPGVVFMTPTDFQPVRIDKTTDGIYIWGHPSMPGPFTMWGVPLKLTTAVTANTAVLGDYANFSNLYIRRGVDVQISNSHDDYFVNGKQAIRADLRVAMVHYRPSAFCEVTGI